jgi:hypothetical protein
MMMKRKPRVLWVEDGALTELSELFGPVYAEGNYLLEVAQDATEATRKLARTTYDAVVVDIRIPPGADNRWIQLHRKGGSNNTQARLGIDLIAACLDVPSTGFQFDNRPSWLSPAKIGVLSVESKSEIQPILGPWGVSIIYQKRIDASRRILLTVIEEILQNNGGVEEDASSTQ